MPNTILKAPEKTPLDRLIDDYLAHCRARGLSSKTVKFVYAYVLRNVFTPFCQREGITEPSQVTRRAMDRFTTELLDGSGRPKPLARTTVHSYGRGVNSFLRWAAGEGEIKPDVKAQLPRLGRKIIDVLSRDEIMQMEDASQTERDRLIIRVLADTGIRVGELVGLSTYDVVAQGRRNYIKVLGKGSLERLVPIGPALHARLRKYIDRQRPKHAFGDALFVSHRRLDGEYGGLSASGVEQMVSGLAENAGIKKRVWPHLLRHSFITWSLTKGMNPIQLAQIVGHSSLTMIQQVYSHLTAGDAYDAMIRVLRTDN